MSITKSSYNQIEQDYNTISDAISAKPAILQAILTKAQRRDNEYPTDNLKEVSLVKLGNTEKLYQATLNKQADHLFDLYKSLPIAKKVDLLIYAEKIGEINDNLRKQATEKMQVTPIAAISMRHTVLAPKEEITLKHASAKDHEPNQTPHNTRAHSNPLTKTESVDDVAKKIRQTHSIAITDTNIEKRLIQQKPATPPIPQEEGLVNQIGLGSPAAVTINFPFTVIPGLPALSQILEKIDKTTHFDLGITVKAIADVNKNPNGEHDLLYRLNYVGVGIMSSKFNMQAAPIAFKLEDSTDQEKWGGSASVFTRQHSDGLGSKVSLNFNDSDAGASYAHEHSYQKPSNKIISTLTAGKYFDNATSFAIRIPADYVPSIKGVVSALPDKEETAIILDRINKVIPINQAFELGVSVAEKVSHLVENEKPAITAAKNSLLQEVMQIGLSAKAQVDVLARIYENHQKNTEFGSLEATKVKENTQTQQSSDAKQR